MFEVITTQGKARRGHFSCAHGTAETPVFMNVGTQGAIKGALDAGDLKNIHCQIELSNTYHLHVRPGDQVIKQLGGLHKFMNWDGPILTDSGGFQVFSLAKLRNIKEEGVTFHSHVDGRKIFMGPEESMTIQANLGSDIAMAFDECVENPSTHAYAKQSCERTMRWLERCIEVRKQLLAEPDCVNPQQMLFGINQGAIYPNLRIWHAKEIAKLPCDGYAIGGLAVGEPTETMYEILDAVVPYLPQDKPRYLMGVGTPWNIIEGVATEAWTSSTALCLPVTPVTASCSPGRVSSTSRTKNISWTISRSIPTASALPAGTTPAAYLRHLFKAEEMLAMRLAVTHNLWFYNDLMARIRAELEAGTFDAFRAEYSEGLMRRL